MRRKSSTGISRIECCSCSLFVLCFFLQVGLREVRESLSKHMVLCWAVWFNQYWNSPVPGTTFSVVISRLLNSSSKIKPLSLGVLIKCLNLEGTAWSGKVDCNTSLVP